MYKIIKKCIKCNKDIEIDVDDEHLNKDYICRKCILKNNEEVFKKEQIQNN